MCIFPAAPKGRENGGFFCARFPFSPQKPPGTDGSGGFPRSRLLLWLEASRAAHAFGQLFDALDWKRRLRQRLHGDRQKLQRVVVRRRAVGRKCAAALTAVDDRPLAALSRPDGDRLGSIMPPQPLSRLPGSISTCRLERQFGQWLQCSDPAFSGATVRPHAPVNTVVSFQKFALEIEIWNENPGLRRNFPARLHSGPASCARSPDRRAGSFF